jgi:hypothetical protein
MSYVPAVQNQNISYTEQNDAFILKNSDTYVPAVQGNKISMRAGKDGAVILSSSGRMERLLNEIPKITIKGSAKITKKNSTVYIMLYRLNPVSGNCNKIIHTKINKKGKFNIDSSIKKTKNDVYLFILQWDLKDNDDVQVEVDLKTSPSTLKSNFGKSKNSNMTMILVIIIAIVVAFFGYKMYKRKYGFGKRR